MTIARICLTFGAILYEMLSGKRAFHADTPADTMSAILKSYIHRTFPETNRVVLPGLSGSSIIVWKKNQMQRFQSAGDVAFNPEALTEVSGTGQSGDTIGRVSGTTTLETLLY